MPFLGRSPEKVGISDGSIVTAKIADDAITAAKIADDAVVTAAIADDAITAALIADDAVVTASVADNAITSALLAAGAGGLDWDTTAKTSNFTAVAEKGYLLNTAGGAVTVTLPASATVGDKITIVDATASASANNITIARNGLKIYGGTSDVILSRDRASTSLIYADTTNGWVPYGGEDYYTNYGIEVLIVAGGGSGGANKSNGNGSGGGGDGKGGGGEEAGETGEGDQ